MISNLKYLLIFLAVLLYWEVPPYSLDEPHVFDSLYYIVGTTTKEVTVPSSVSLVGRKIVFYKTYPDSVSITLESTDPNKFVLNVYDNMNVPISTKETYYVAIEKGSDGYGSDPVAVALRPEGWNEVALTLKKDTGSSPKTLSLSIKRENDTPDSDITVSWLEDLSTSPDIYALFGDGSGSFSTDKSKWTRVNEDPNFQIDFSNKKFKHLKQVRAGYFEVYYKGLYSGTDTSYLASADAVGKVNLTIEASPSNVKLNLISLPLIPEDSSISSVFGSQFEGAEGTGFQDGDYAYYLEPGEATPQSFYSSSGWSGTLTNINPDRGYVAIVQKNHPQRIITLVGNVATASREGIAIKRTNSNGLNLLGSAYPNSVSLSPDKTGLSSTNPQGGTGFQNADYLYTFGSDSTPQSYYNGTTWSGTLSKLSLTKGYVYIKQNDGTVYWTYSKPY